VQFVPENAVTPLGPLVVPLTCPLPAVIEVDRPPAVTWPLRVVTTVQSERRLPLEELVLDDPPALVDALELDPVELLVELLEL